MVNHCNSFASGKAKLLLLPQKKKRAAHSAAQCCALFAIKQKMNSNQITKSNEMRFSQYGSMTKRIYDAEPMYQIMRRQEKKKIHRKIRYQKSTKQRISFSKQCVDTN